MKPALLVVDVQKLFFDRPITAESLNSAIENINEAIAYFREKNLPIAAVQHVDPESGLMPGAEGFDLPDHLCIEAGDIRIQKTYGNSFNKTELESELRKRGVDTVIVTGFCAEYCVLSACRGADDRDFSSMILRGAIASATPERIPFVEAICDVVSLGALKKLLENR